METERFSRQEKIGWWNQRKISNVNAIVVGCGGIGTWTAMQLTFIGVRKLTLIDMDTVDESNLNRQLFFHNEIGNSKVEALADKIRKLNPSIRLVEFPGAVEGLPAEEWKGATVVFDCLDNIPTRKYLEKLCLEKKIPLFHSACSDVIGEVSIILPDNTVRMDYPASMEADVKPANCKEFAAAVCTTNMIVASLQVDKFLDWLLKGDSATKVMYMRGRGITYK